MIKALLWFIILFVLALVISLFLLGDVGIVSIFFYPWRIDLSLNLTLVLLLVGFVVFYLAVRAVSLLLHIPKEAMRWRVQQKERQLLSQLTDTSLNFIAGRYTRSRKLAEQIAITAAISKNQKGVDAVVLVRIQVLAHLLVAESAHALLSNKLRDEHMNKALELAENLSGSDGAEAVELRAARWAYEDQKPRLALQWLEKLPDGAGRRILALRLRFQAQRLTGDAQNALETVRLITKHHGFSILASQTISYELIHDLFKQAYDAMQVKKVWSSLSDTEKAMSKVVLLACDYLYAVGGDGALVRQWIKPLWTVLADRSDTLSLEQRIKVARLLERSFGEVYSDKDAEWLKSIEEAQLRNPQDGVLQFLAGAVYLRLQLWGKSGNLLQQALRSIRDFDFQREVWRTRAHLAEAQNDTEAANLAYRKIAKLI